VSHYLCNLRDLKFNLFEVLRVQRLMGSGGFEGVDLDTASSVLDALEELAVGPLAASFADADRHPPTFDPATHSAVLPESLKESYRRLLEGDWGRLWLPVELGGYGMPPSVQWAAAELLVGSNPPLYLYFTAVPNSASVIHRLGTAEQKHWAQLMVDRGWGATMMLTEPDAGSDVGAARTKAVAQPDGSWHLDGVKRFITSGDQDLTENIMHLVLARPEGPGVTTRPGTKGLSLFLVPKSHFDTETGRIGERNGVFATNLEHKMGFRGSTTCELTLGRHGVPARGWLLGGVHDGIAQMFQVIEWARMTVGAKAIGTMSTGYLNALAYARARIQGADLARFSDKTAPRVAITRHPDVRRSLMLQKAYTEGLRALYLYTASIQDRIAAGDGDVATAERVNDLLLPVIKGAGSERAFEQLAQSLQILGGSGFLQDYPIEQYLRDSKIDSLYEGTTAIQAQDFFFRKIVKDEGVALAYVTGEISAFVAAEDGNGRLKQERALLKQALDDVQAMVGALVGYLTGSLADPAEIYKAGQHAVRLLMSVGDLLVGWLLQRQAEVALARWDAAEPGRDTAFYQGKVAAAAFFAKTVLPELSARRAVVEGADNALMDVLDDAF
jgi:alkylation response protein AidB-like acyl-CoA dehydrogenase